MIKSAESKLRPIVIDMINKDNKFKGWAGYIMQVSFFWSEEIPTACAGHGFIFFNPNFWDKLDEARQKTVIAHEICHLILDHLNRGEGFDPESYNIAGDYVINPYLKNEGFEVRNPFGDIEILLDQKYNGKTTEQIYNIVHKERKQNPKKHPLSGSPSKSEIEDLVQEALDSDKDKPEDVSEQAKKNKNNHEIAQKAATSSPGNKTGNSARLLEAVKKVVIQNATYQKIFEPYLTDPLSGGKRTFMRPSRRQGNTGLRMKGRFPKKGKHNRLTHLVYALDVSGSITHEQANQFVNSAGTIKKILNPSRMTVMLWDTQIKFEKTYRDDEPLGKIHVQAGGGTCLDPVYRRVKQLNPEALVIFTDLAVAIPPEPNWKTIWFVPDNNVYDNYLQKVNYGEVYRVPE